MSDFHARSFDPPRGRVAVSELRGTLHSGEEITVVLSRLTLIVAVKPHCDGCHEFVFGDLSELNGVDVVFLSASASDDGEWGGATQRVLVSPEAMRELDIRSAPHYVLIDPVRSRVVTEGVLFSPAQVASEIAPFLNS
ncbi:MAG TPA: hypothetical protein VIJ40_00420 [Acidimicrobiales bacterium]